MNVSFSFPSSHLSEGTLLQLGEETDTLQLVLENVERGGQLRPFGQRIESDRAADLIVVQQHRHIGVFSPPKGAFVTTVCVCVCACRCVCVSAEM